MTMNSASDSIEELRREILNTEENLRNLRARLVHLQATRDKEEAAPKNVQIDSGWPLSAEEYRRYGRQMIVSSVGLQAGGLGCPAAAYIAGAGVGKIGMLDGDIVELSNLHRQILHSTEKLGMKKVLSVIEYMRSLNPNLQYVPHAEHITPQTASSIIQPYDLVLDCTDNPATRYLISDTCVLLQKSLISASALRTDGQLVILNSPPLHPGDETGGPCYRCVFPKPPPPDSVVSCGEGGILGPVVGVMGVLQAVEAIKLITSGRLKGSSDHKAEANSMLLFSANSSPPFRTVRLRGRRAGCFACSKDSQLSLEGLQNGSLDYVQFCGLASPVKVLEPEDRIDARDYARAKAKEHVLLDVREKVQFEICSLPGSINVPFSQFQGTNTKLSEDPDWIPGKIGKDAPIYVVCRLGNDSQIVARKLKDAGLDMGGRWIGDIRGGLRAWREQVDTSWPEY